MASKLIALGNGCSIELLYGAVACTPKELQTELALFPTQRNPTVFNAMTPRREVLYSVNVGTTYAFSRKTLVASEPSTVAARCLAVVKTLNDSAVEHNTVLGNLYESGKDYVAHHGDDEPEHGAGAAIYGFSFGATRTFQIKRTDKSAVVDGKQYLNVELPHGSCVIMRGAQFQSLFTTGRARRITPKIVRSRKPPDLAILKRWQK